MTLPQKTIAYLEDDLTIRANIAEALRESGYVVNEYSTTDEAKEGIAVEVPDLTMLDITIGRDQEAGFELCAHLRRQSETLPILFLTGHDDEIDKVSGMRLGADDYLTKDTNIRYILVRIEALLRRVEAYKSVELAAPRADSEPQSQLSIDEATSQASWRGLKVELPLTQFWILSELHRNSGSVCTMSNLMKAGQIVVEPNTIASYIKKIRAAILQLDPSFDAIKTERGRGYRWSEY